MMTNNVLVTGGEIKDGIHRMAVRVYYADTDFSGVVYHGRYLEFFERGRTECLRFANIHHRELIEATEGEKLAWVVRRMSLDYAKPATIDDVLIVETWVRQISGARIKIAQRLLRGSERLVDAEVEVALIAADGRPRRFPYEWVEHFTPVTRPA